MTEPDDAASAAAPAIDAERARKKVKTLFGWLFFRRFSLPLSLLLARTPVKPWQVTAFGLACGLAGAALLATGAYSVGLAGGALVLVAKLMDAVDGEVARAKHLDTPGGYVADGMCDRLRDTAVVTGLGVGALRSGYPSIPALAWTMAALVGYLGFFYVSSAAPAHWREMRSDRDLDAKHMFRVGGVLRLGAGDTLAVAVMAAAAVGRPLWLVMAIAALSPIAIALKVRRLFVLRPWERDTDDG